MSEPVNHFATPADWIATEAIPFSLDMPDSLNAAVDRLVATLGDSVEVLGLGEPTHQVETFLTFRNRVFERLVERHGYTAIAVESSFPRGRLANDYVQGGESASFDDVMERGFNHGFGAFEANRALIEWMRRYNAEHPDRKPLRFDGCDGPMEMMYTDSPRVLLHFVLDYLAPLENAGGSERRQRIDALLGDDAPWENQEAAYDPAKSIGLSPEAKSLAVEAQKLNVEMRKRRDELIAATGEDRYLAASHDLAAARQLLTYHAIVATASDKRINDLLSQRDLMMADNVKYLFERERRRGGKLFVFAHNSHLKLGQATWQWGENAWAWWPAGSHLRGMLGPRYAVIGVGANQVPSQNLGPAEPGTLEALLEVQSPLFLPTHLGQGLPTEAIAALPIRSTNPGYFPFTSQSFSDFDVLALLP